VPEGDTVWLAAARLDAALTGRIVASSDFRLPGLATLDVSGRRIESVAARGKHLFIRLDPLGDDPAISLHTHFRMDGSWHLYQPGDRWHGGPTHQIRVILQVPDRVAIGYRLHEVSVHDRAAEDAVVGHLGPDVLGTDWDPAEAVRRLAADPAAEIGPALLDQRNLAGIGNLYETEVLFLRGITPWTPVRDVGDLGDLAALVHLAHRLLRANRDRREQATTGSARRGEEHWVYQRAGRPCRRCGARILASGQARRAGIRPERDERSRLSYWCPRCQRGPSPSGTGGDGHPTPA
jgi:endonuclease-8